MDKIYIVIDNSGSMRDNGKASLAANLIQIFRRQLLPDVELSFFKWDKALSQIDSTADFDFSGTTDSEPLISFLSDKEFKPIILIGDGVIDRSLRRALVKSGSLYLAVGCDCDIRELQRYLGESHVFTWADSITCLRMLLAKTTAT